jgi:triphosphatase
MTAPPTETELKLQLAAAHVERLRHSAVLSKSVCTEVDIDNVYFDTKDRLLQRHRMALRVRQIGRRWVQTLKTSSENGGAVSRRGEWETPARVVRGQGRLDLARLSESPLQDLLAKQKRRAELEPVFRTRVRRAQWIVKRGDASIEVALDVGEISAEVEHRSLREPICELELELKQTQGQGGAAALIDLALELLDVGGKAPPALTPVARSKAERGYQLVAQRPAPAVKASAKAFVENVTHRSTTASALRAVVAHGLAVLTANIEFLLRYDDPEYVHQSRVALRRVRSAIRLFDREQRDVPRSLSDELRWFARALGEARDWDVITDETLPSLSDAIGVDAVKLLVARADARRRQARMNIRKAARSARYAALALNGERWCMTPIPPGAALIADAASPALKRASKKLFKCARFFAALSAPRRHRVRILAKRLRYALDLFAVALPKQRTARYIAALSVLQDVLGQLNDASVARSVLSQLSKSARLRTSADKWLRSVEHKYVPDAERRLLTLSTRQKSWQ